MKRREVNLPALASVLLVLLASSCAPQPSKQDKERAEALALTYVDRFKFEFRRDTYFEMAALSDPAPTEAEARNVFRFFWLEPGNVPRLDSKYVYLNVYDHRGVFEFQLHWDPEGERVVRSAVEHY